MGVHEERSKKRVGMVVQYQSGRIQRQMRVVCERGAGAEPKPSMSRKKWLRE